MGIVSNNERWLEPLMRHMIGMMRQRRIVKQKNI
jgi:hypothetical protein